MAVTRNTVPASGQPAIAVDSLVDERGSRIDLPENATVEPTSDPERAVAATSPTNWWLIGLIALAIVIAILFGMQMLNGAPGTDVQTGTPTSEPVVPVEPTPAAP